MSKVLLVPNSERFRGEIPPAPFGWLFVVIRHVFGKRGSFWGFASEC